MALTAGGLATLAGTAQAAHPSGVVIVTPASGLLDFRETRSKGHNEFLEDGLHVYTEGNSSQDKAAGYLAEDLPLADVGEPTMDWTPTDPSLPAEPGLQLVVDFDHNGVSDGTLVGESVYDNVWWLSNGSATFVKDGAPNVGGGYGSPYYGTLDEWRASFPDAQDRAFGYSMGSGVYGDGVIHQLTLADTTYRFAAGIGPCEAAIDESTKTYTLTKDCSTFTTITVPDGWTLDGAGYTLTAVEDADHQNFPGPIVTSVRGENVATEMNVTNLHIETSGFENGSNSNGDLSGIRFFRAGGSVTHVTVDGVSHGNGVQEGDAIIVRDASEGSPSASIDIDDVTVTNYQKTGIVINGDVDFSLTDSTIGSAGGPNGEPNPDIAANSVQIAYGAHGTVTGNHVDLNEYNAPDGAYAYDATAFIVYDAGDVTFERNVIAGDNGDVGLDAYNDGAEPNTLTLSCNLFSRDEAAGDDDPYGVGIATYDDGSTPVDVQLSDTTFVGWNYDTAEISYDNDGNNVFGPGAVNQSLGECPPTAPSNVGLSGGDEQTDVTWNAATAPEYAPLAGYTVTATAKGGGVVATKDVGPNTTSTHLTGLLSGVDYTISVVATSAGGTSNAATATLHATFLTLEAARSEVTSGEKVKLSGNLSSTDGSAQLAGRQVSIQRRNADSSAEWKTIATVTVAADGSFEQLVKPSVNTEFRATYAGAPDNSSVSDTVRVDVALRLTVRISGYEFVKGDRVLFSGSVSPNHAGFPVELQLLNEDDDEWNAVNGAKLDRKSRFALRYKLKATGVYMFRVVAQGDDGHTGAISKTYEVTVRERTR